MVEQAQAAGSSNKDKDNSITGEVFIPTLAFDSGALDDADARDTFAEDNKLTKAQAGNIVMTGKKHTVGTGILYTFRVDEK